MKAGTRALGIAESYRGERGRSTLAGAVVRASRVVDGFVVGSCAIGGTDATEAIVDLHARLDRADVNYLFVSGIAPAWYNVLDLQRLHDATGIPVLSISFEESEGLEPALREEFSGDALATRLDTYRAQPPRRRCSVNDETLFVRSVGIDDEGAARVVRGFTLEGGRPEPLRVARLAARAADSWTTDESKTGSDG
ncbi:hypothetical protein C448_03013 [Halococcus morrhuae DSM 1307]|uniref:UPF0215 protein C448_03013 n=1 Tax=Halococcus morrhuae DSM 1307 TaxID=931277 RepID=M0MWI7_HALMO|nr:DUF99 family protein [Halococcus morrhuae]EMA48805.1 hypothetical protein C448_03013 [Halococcus morrhuae DSM 1307]